MEEECDAGTFCWVCAYRNCDEHINWCKTCDGKCNGYIGDKSCPKAKERREWKIEALMEIMMSYDKDVVNEATNRIMKIHKEP